MFKKALYQDSKFVERANFMVAESYYNEGNLKKALKLFSKFQKDFKNSDKIPVVVERLKDLNSSKTAKETGEKIKTVKSKKI